MPEILDTPETVPPLPPESVALSPIEAALFTELRKAAKEIEQAGRDIEQRAQGALALIIRQRGRDGNWSLTNGGDALVRAK